MRRWMLRFLLIILPVLGGLVFVGGVLAYQQPFPPGHPLYAVQYRLGRRLVSLLPAEWQAPMALHFLARHTEWMEQIRGTSSEVDAVEAFDQALAFSVRVLGRVPPQSRRLYQAQWTRLLMRGQRALSQATYVATVRPDLLTRVESRVDLALDLAQEQGLIAALPTPTPGSSDAEASSSPPSPVPEGTPTVTPLPRPQPIAFPTDFAARHTFFPLTGEHGRISCESCHQRGRFSDLPRSCRICHMKDWPADHFQGECSLCHGTEAWRPASFDHAAAGATDCQSCHLGDRPPNHFQGQCSLCHGTRAWKPARFNHAAAGATDCQSCHLKDRPPNHFQGQCSLCHSTTAWRPARFNHRFPINHGGANGVCSTCHPSGTVAYTCSACHSPARMRAEHAEEGISNIAGRCVVCHPDGREHEGYGGESEGEDD